jgi:hypothetical protein
MATASSEGSKGKSNPLIDPGSGSNGGKLKELPLFLVLWHGHKLRLIKGRQWVFIKVLPSFRGDSNLSAFRNRIICVDMGQCKCWSTAWTLLGNVKSISHAPHTHPHLTPQLSTDIPILVFGPTERGICHPMRLADKDSSIQPSQPCYYPNPCGKSTLCEIYVHAQQRLPSCSFTTS